MGGHEVRHRWGGGQGQLELGKSCCWRLVEVTFAGQQPSLECICPSCADSMLRIARERRSSRCSESLKSASTVRRCPMPLFGRGSEPNHKACLCVSCVPSRTASCCGNDQSLTWPSTSKWSVLRAREHCVRCVGVIKSRTASCGLLAGERAMRGWMQLRSFNHKATTLMLMSAQCSRAQTCEPGFEVAGKDKKPVS